MDELLELLPLLFIAGYYLLRGRQRAAQKRVRQEAPQRPLIEGEEPAEEPRLTPFQQFLQQIDEAVAEAAGESVEKPPPPPAEAPSPLPAPPAKPVRPAAPMRPAPEFRAVAGSFDAKVPTDHVRHGFGSDNPLSEGAFERRPPQAPRPASRPPLDPHGLGTADPQPASRRTPDWRTRLQDPEAAREAFVLQTIFGPRGGRRGTE